MSAIVSSIFFCLLCFSTAVNSFPLPLNDKFVSLGGQKNQSSLSSVADDHRERLRKYLPFVAELANRHVPPTMALKNQQEDLIEHWKKIGPKVNSILAQLETTTSKKSDPRLPNDELFDWFIGGFGEESKFGDQYKKLKSRSARSYRSADRSKQPVEVNGVAVKVLDGLDGKTGTAFKFEVKKPAGVKPVPESKAIAEKLTDPQQEEKIPDSDFFAPRVDRVRRSTQVDNLNPNRQIIFEIVNNIQRLRKALAEIKNCKSATPNVLRALRPHRNLTMDQILKICEDVAKSNKKRHAEEVTTDAPLSTVEDDDDDDEDYEEGKGGPYDDLLGLASTLVESVESTVGSLLKKSKPVDIEEPISPPSPTPIPEPSTTMPAIDGAKNRRKNVIFGGLFNEEEEDEEEDKEVQEPSNSTLKAYIGHIATSFISSLGGKGGNDEEQLTSTTESIVTAGKNAFADVNEDMEQVEDAGADLKFAEVKDEDVNETPAKKDPKKGAKEKEVRPPIAVTPRTLPSEATSTVAPTESEEDPETTRVSDATDVTFATFPGGQTTPVTEKPEPTDDNRVPTPDVNFGESKVIDEDKFHRHVVVSLGIMALMGMVAIVVMAMLRESVVSRGSVEVEEPNIDDIIPRPRADTKECTVSVSMEVVDGSGNKESIQMSSKPKK